jgi:hypothetical protein
MYCMLLWDKKAETQDRLLHKIEISVELANQIFALPSASFPILSTLSFVDFDLFSDDDLNQLRQEFENFTQLNEIHAVKTLELIDLVREAELKNKAILFDPFR